MEIKIIGPDQIHALQLISRQTFSETFGDHNSKENIQLYINHHYTLENLKKELTNPDTRFYFLTDGNELKGYLKLNRGMAQTENQGDEALEIERIYIIKQAQGFGYGKELLNKAVQLSIEEGLPFLWLGVWENNVSAIRFYERNGFIPFGEHVFMLGNDSQRDILMKFDLK
jgi:ribosomal protein S18 acetylase RimI-like enzyme